MFTSQHFFLSFIVQPKDQSFEFPDVFDIEAQEAETSKTLDQVKEQQMEYKRFLNRNKDSRGSPPWFSI